MSAMKRKKGITTEVLPAQKPLGAPVRPRSEPKTIEIEPDDSEDSLDDQEPQESEMPEALDHDAGSANLPATIAERDLVAISPQDPLRRYLEEVRRHPLLSPEEEYELASRMVRDGDISAARKLVEANLRLVIKIAFEYRSTYSNVMDLIQEGNIGLMKAVSKYDPSHGARFGYYASWWIRSYILKYLLDNFRLVKIGTTQAQKKLFYHLTREMERMEAMGITAGPKLLADKLNVKEKEVVEMQQRLSGRGAELSLDSPVDHQEGDGAASTFLDFLADENEGPDSTLAREQLLQILKQRLPAFQKTLSDKEKRLLEDRLLSEEPKTLQDVADLYGLTRERARQIEAKVIEKLREFLADALKEKE